MLPSTLMSFLPPSLWVLQGLTDWQLSYLLVYAGLGKGFGRTNNGWGWDGKVVLLVSYHNPTKFSIWSLAESASLCWQMKYQPIHFQFYLGNVKTKVSLIHTEPGDLAPLSQPYPGPMELFDVPSLWESYTWNLLRIPYIWSNKNTLQLTPQF